MLKAGIGEDLVREGTRTHLEEPRKERAGVLFKAVVGSCSQLPCLGEGLRSRKCRLHSK